MQSQRLGSVLVLVLSALVGSVLYFLFMMETTPQWITGTFLPHKRGMEFLSYWAKSDEEMVPQKPFSVLCIHGAWNNALVWDLGEHEKYFEQENNNFLEKFATDFGYNAHALSFRFHGKSTGNDTTLVPDWIGRRLTRIGDYVEDLRVAMEHVYKIDQEGNKLVLLCHDMGCFVTMKMLEKYGNDRDLMDRVAGIVMLSPVGYNGNFVHTVRNVMLPNMTYQEIAQSILQFDATPMMANPHNTKAYYVPVEVGMKMGMRFHEKLVERESLIAILDMMFAQLVRPEKIRQNLLTLKRNKPLPIYIMFSGNDRLIGKDQYMETVNMFKREVGNDVVETTFDHLLPNLEVAHHMMYGDKWKTVYGLIVDFLRKRARNQ